MFGKEPWDVRLSLCDLSERRCEGKLKAKTTVLTAFNTVLSRWVKHRTNSVLTFSFRLLLPVFLCFYYRFLLCSSLSTVSQSVSQDGKEPSYSNCSTWLWKNIKGRCGQLLMMLLPRRAQVAKISRQPPRKQETHSPSRLSSRLLSLYSHCFTTAVELGMSSIGPTLKTEISWQLLDGFPCNFEQILMIPTSINGNNCANLDCNSQQLLEGLP